MFPAAISHNVGTKPVGVEMLGEKIVLFRDDSGKVVAINDVCPHRGAPLHEGENFRPFFFRSPIMQRGTPNKAAAVNGRVTAPLTLLRSAFVPQSLNWCTGILCKRASCCAQRRLERWIDT